jgi:hypothetical protein
LPLRCGFPSTAGCLLSAIGSIAQKALAVGRLESSVFFLALIDKLAMKLQRRRPAAHFPRAEKDWQ